MRPLPRAFHVESPYPRDAPGGVEGFVRWAQTEARALLRDDVESGDWKLEHDKDGIELWSRPVEDRLGKMTRTEVGLAADAEDIFQLMISKAGFEIIDPGTKNHHAPPIESLPWSGSGPVECVLACAPSPGFPLSDREFVVCNMFDEHPSGTELPLFVSKSIDHPSHPRKASKAVRALNTFALQVVPVEAGECKLCMLNYADFGGWFPTFLMDMIDTKIFMQQLIERLRKHLGAREVVPAARA